MCLETHSIIILIIFGTGLLGGLTNYLILFDSQESKIRPLIQIQKLAATILLSLCASLTVPLFLQILSNNLLDNPDFKNLLIFAGFCVIASFFSKRFLEDVYAKLNRLDRKVDDVKEDLKDASSKSEMALKKSDDLEESLEEGNDLQVDQRVGAAIIEQLPTEDENVANVLVATLVSGNYSFRTVRGIAKETGLDEQLIENVLKALLDKGIVEHKIGQTGQILWRVLKYPIKIYSASYGIEGKTVDVTSRIKEFVAKRYFRGPVNNDYLAVKDPVVGQVKKLKIHCRIYGQEKELVFNEHETFDLEG